MAKQTGVKMFGAYVANMSTSVGWGGQGGSMQIKLVEDLPNDVGISKLNINGKLEPFAGEVTVDIVSGEIISDELSAEAALSADPPTAKIVGTPKVGTPVYFKYGAFWFGGIFQRWTYSESTSGRTYDIVIESPSKLMDGVQLVIEDWAGFSDAIQDPSLNPDNDPVETNYSTNISSFFGADNRYMKYDNIKNIYNLFGYLENDIVGGHFGGSNFNSSGVECDTLMTSLQILANRRSIHPLGGPINFKGTQYSLDVSAIQASLAAFGWNTGFSSAYRIKGPVKSVNGLISEICDILQIDYFYDIVPDVEGVDPDALLAAIIRNTDDGGGKLIDPTIKVRVVSRQQQPNPNAISRWITEQRNTVAAGTAPGATAKQVAAADSALKITSFNIGQELGDAVTQKAIYGGRRTRYHIKTIELGSSDIRQIYGKATPSEEREPRYWLDRDSSPTTASFEPTRLVSCWLGNDYGGGVEYKMTLFEIRMAMAGKKSWEIFKTFETMAGCEPNGSITYDGYTANTNDLEQCPWTGSFEGSKTILTDIRNNRGNCWLLKRTNVREAPNQYKKWANKLSDQIFKGVSNIANNFYCQQFLIPVGDHDEYSSGHTQEFLTRRDWEPCDAAFVEDRATKDLAFFDSNGRQKSICGWSRQPYYDYSGLGSAYSKGTGANWTGLVLTTKGGPSGELVKREGQHWVAFNTGCVVKHFDNITTPDWGYTVLAKYFFDEDIPPKSYFKPGFNKALQFAIPPDNAMPVRFGIPEQATRYNYGPWLTVAGANAIPIEEQIGGKAAVEGNEGMRPENFGGYAGLNLMGSIMATVGIGNMTQNESGSVDVAGMPTGNIGEVFADSGPYCTDLSVSVDATGGVTSSYKFNTWTPNFGKLAKYNIDRISATNKSAWDYAKKMRDRVEKRPFPAFNMPEKKTIEDLIAAQAGKPDLEGFEFVTKTHMDQRKEGQGADVGNPAEEDGEPVAGAGKGDVENADFDTMDDPAGPAATGDQFDN